LNGRKGAIKKLRLHQSKEVVPSNR
jgi:hypothetical protein